MVWLSFRRCSVQVEERKNLHINELMKKHEKAFGEIKNYYNDITHNNLDLIKYDSFPVHPCWLLRAAAVPGSETPSSQVLTTTFEIPAAA